LRRSILGSATLNVGASFEQPAGHLLAPKPGYLQLDQSNPLAGQGFHLLVKTAAQLMSVLKVSRSVVEGHELGTLPDLAAKAEERLRAF
jgi:hypothetical protein